MPAIPIQSGYVENGYWKYDLPDGQPYAVTAGLWAGCGQPERSLPEVDRVVYGVTHAGAEQTRFMQHVLTRQYARGARSVALENDDRGGDLDPYFSDVATHARQLGMTVYLIREPTDHYTDVRSALRLFGTRDGHCYTDERTIRRCLQKALGTAAGDHAYENLAANAPLSDATEEALRRRSPLRITRLSAPAILAQASSAIRAVVQTGYSLDTALQRTRDAQQRYEDHMIGRIAADLPDIVAVGLNHMRRVAELSGYNARNTTLWQLAGRVGSERLEHKPEKDLGVARGLAAVREALRLLQEVSKHDALDAGLKLLRSAMGLAGVSADERGVWHRMNDHLKNDPLFLEIVHRYVIVKSSDGVPLQPESHLLMLPTRHLPWDEICARLEAGLESLKGRG